jgi:hypothetical protein
MSMSEMITQVADLSLADKLSLIDSVIASIRKEGGIAGKKKAKGEKATSDEKKPKRKAALGTLAWTAYVKHCKTTMPESFEGLSKESEKLVIVKGIRAEDPEGYTAFTEAWKLEHAEVSDASVSEAETESVAEEVVAPVKAKPVSAKAAAKPAAAPKPAAAAAAAEPKAAPKPVKVAKAAEKPAAKPVKKAVKAAKVEEATMPQKEIDGVSYWHDPESNGLWEVTGETVADGTGAWIGYFQPGDEAEPIRFTEAFGSD